MEQQIENKIKGLIEELNLEGEISLEDVKEIILNEKDGGFLTEDQLLFLTVTTVQNPPPGLSKNIIPSKYYQTHNSPNQEISSKSTYTDHR